MIRIITAALASVALVGVYVVSPSFGATCKEEAAKKNLAGAALKSFMSKCERDAQSACDSKAAQQKLAGAAKSSFTKKCVSDAVGS